MNHHWVGDGDRIGWDGMGMGMGWGWDGMGWDGDGDGMGWGWDGMTSSLHGMNKCGMSSLLV